MAKKEKQNNEEQPKEILDIQEEHIPNKFLRLIQCLIETKIKEITDLNKGNTIDNVQALHQLKTLHKAKDIFEAIGTNEYIAKMESCQNILRLFINTLTLDQNHLYNSGFYIQKLDDFKQLLTTLKKRFDLITEVFSYVLQNHYQEFNNQIFVFERLYKVQPINKTRDFYVSIDFELLKNAFKKEKDDYNLQIAKKVDKKEIILFERNYSTRKFTPEKIEQDIINVLKF